MTAEAIQRAAALMQQRLAEFESDRLSLDALLTDLEALIASVDDQADPDWIESLRSAWWQFEYVNAVAIDERRGPTAEEHHELRRASRDFRDTLARDSLPSGEMPMRKRPVTLVLGNDVRRALETLLRTALVLPEGAPVVDHLSRNPWSDLEDFRRQVHQPLHGSAVLPLRTRGQREIRLEAADVGTLRDVLDGLAESFSGGIPWAPLTSREREVVQRVASKLMTDG